MSWDELTWQKLENLLDEAAVCPNAAEQLNADSASCEAYDSRENNIGVRTKRTFTIGYQRRAEVKRIMKAVKMKARRVATKQTRIPSPDVESPKFNDQVIEPQFGRRTSSKTASFGTWAKILTALSSQSGGTTSRNGVTSAHNVAK